MERGDKVVDVAFGKAAAALKAARAEKKPVKKAAGPATAKRAKKTTAKRKKP